MLSICAQGMLKIYMTYNGRNTEYSNNEEYGHKDRIRK